ncbi:hypothetical protein ACOMHN_029711 [Nucella lapillus]
MLDITEHDNTATAVVKIIMGLILLTEGIFLLIILIEVVTTIVDQDSHFQPTADLRLVAALALVDLTEVEVLDKIENSMLLSEVEATSFRGVTAEEVVVQLNLVPPMSVGNVEGWGEVRRNHHGVTQRASAGTLSPANQHVEGGGDGASCWRDVTGQPGGASGGRRNSAGRQTGLRGYLSNQTGGVSNDYPLRNKKAK